MTFLTLNIPDETIPGPRPDHSHKLFNTLEEAQRWVSQVMRYVHDLRVTYTETERPFCMVCWQMADE